MILSKHDEVRMHRFVFDGDKPYQMDPITILIDETTNTLTVTDNYTTYSHTWVGFSHDKTFYEFFGLGDWDYVCRKIGLGPTCLNLRKSKRNALSYFFRYIYEDTNRDKDLKSEIISQINDIHTNDRQEFEILAHNILDGYSDCWECNFAECEWAGTEKNMLDAIKMLAKVIRNEFQPT